MSEIMDQVDAGRLDLTLNVREKIIRKLTEGDKLPEDITDRDFLMKALDGMDRTVLAKTKIKSDNENAKSMADEAKLISSLLLQMRNKPVSSEPSEPLPELDDLNNTVNEETFIGVQSFKTEQFQNQ